MRNPYSWNRVFNRVMDIKDLYLKTHSSIDYANFGEEETILHFLVKNIEDEIKREFYSDWLKTLEVRQNGHNVLLHYNLIASAAEMWSDINSINIEARSIYIDIENENIILCPMPKFFNIDEVKENAWDIILDKINKASIFEIAEKLDGSNQNAGYYMDKVVLCGSTACDPNNSWRVVEGYKFIEENDGYSKMIKDFPNKTFCFEFIHPEDIHVVSFKEGTAGLYLLCIRDNFDGSLSSYKEMKEIADRYGVRSTKIEEYTLDELLKARDSFKADECEGWVLNIDGYRVKFKTTDYLKMHKCFSNRSLTKILIKEIADGTIDDFLASVPTRVRELSNGVIPQITSWVRQKEERIDFYWNKYKDIETKKDFALIVNKEAPKDIVGYLFAKKEKKEYSLLKNKSGHYTRPQDMDIKNVYVKFAEEVKEEEE